MSTNTVLKAIRDRRTVIRFETTPVGEDMIQAILEAGRWAPSWINSQPWRFKVVTDSGVKKRLSENVPTVFNLGITEAPVCIAVCVDPGADPSHFVEDGAAATQNMALAAHSLGLGSSWIGVHNPRVEKGSAEEKIREILKLPKTHRVVSLLPIGVPKYFPEKDRKELSELIIR